MAEIIEYLPSDMLQHIMMDYISSMPLEFDFICGNTRYKHSGDKLIDFVKIFEFRPDEAVTLGNILRSERNRYDRAAPRFEAVVADAEFPENCW